MQTLEKPSSSCDSYLSVQNSGVLHLLCGRIAAGKSTLARTLARRHNAILIGEDDSLSLLYPTEILSFDDYLTYSMRFKKLLKPHCIRLLQQGVNVVLDMPANTVKSRQWLKQIIDDAKARHLLHYLAIPVEQCRQQLHKRIAEQYQQPDERNCSPIALEQFDEINRYFVPPSVEEGFNVEINR